MTRPTQEADWRIIQGDCTKTLKTLPTDAVDAVVTDPPYAISSFRQGDETWDARAIRNHAKRSSRCDISPGEGFEVWCEEWATECLRVMRPGAHLLAFGSPRTFHRLVAGVENAGFEIRDVLMWLYSSGMPKSRRLTGDRGTTLKPAYEPILLARKPPDGTIDETLDRHGTGALEIGRCRTNDRWPANVLFSHSRRCRDDQCASDCAARQAQAGGIERRRASQIPIDRVFYGSKASRRERDAGCEELPARRVDLFPRAGRHKTARSRPVRNPHPTVKPVDVMRWLVRLTCPENGLVLDPFCGSGTTGNACALEGRRFLGIERDESFAEIAKARIAHWSKKPQEAGSGPLDGRAK